MPDNDRISIDSLTLAPELSSDDVTAVVHTVNGVKSTYKSTMTLLGTFLNKILQYSADLHTNNKTIIGAINEINDGGGGGSAVILYGTSAPISSQGSDGNLYVQYTEGTGGASDVVNALYVKLDSEWCQISTGGGGGGTAASVSFDDTNVEFEADDVQEAFESIVKTLTWAQYQALSAAEKNNGTIYYITDKNNPVSYNDVTDKPSINSVELSGNKTAAQLGFASVATSGNYNDLSNKPTIPAAPVNADWNASSGLAQILNKPTIPTVQVFNRADVLLNTVGGTLRGFGSAMITLCDGIARIDFNIMISVDETVPGIGTWGINRDYFTALIGKSITPVAGGVVTYYNQEQIYTGRMDFGGTFLIDSQFWKPARVYDDNGTKKVGGWTSGNFASGQRFIGTCYGTYS